MHQPLIILAAPRSGASLICAMLGQHPNAFDLHELNLCVTDTIEQLIRLSRRGDCTLHGLLKTLAQTHEGVQTEETITIAWNWLCARRDQTTGEVFNHILRSIHPRIGVEYSMSTVTRRELLERIYTMYPRASYLHLTRHPCAPTLDFTNSLTRQPVTGVQSGLGKVAPEQAWLQLNQNICEFSSRLPLAQCMRIQVEELFANPELYFPQIAEWMDIDNKFESVALMLHPERSPFAQVSSANATYDNDPDRFIDLSVLKRMAQPDNLKNELERSLGSELSRPTIKLAKEMGYT